MVTEFLRLAVFLEIPIHLKTKSLNYEYNHSTITPYHHIQNIPQYYMPEQGNNIGVKWSNKMAVLNDPKLNLYSFVL